MDPGKLNRKVSIQRKATGKDAAGQPLDTLVEVAKVWASIVHKSGAESIRADQDVSVVKASIRIRMRSDITNGMEVHHKSTVYEVLAQMPDEGSREWLDLVCEVVQ